MTEALLDVRLLTKQDEKKGESTTIHVMAMSPEHLEVVVSDDGVRLSVAELASMGVRPGDHLRLVKDAETTSAPRKRKSVRGIGVGKVSPEDVLTWEDFEATHNDIVKWAHEKYGDLPE